MSRPRFHFTSVVRLEPSLWSVASVLHDSHVPGTIFLFGEPGTTGGLLKLSSTGDFMTLSRAEVYLQEDALWPESVVTFKLIGNEIIFEMSSV